MEGIAQTANVSTRHFEVANRRVPRRIEMGFLLLLSIIGLISAYDAYLVLRYCEVIMHFEQNPVGVFLIQFNNGDVSLFVRLKLAGTVVVLTVLTALHFHTTRMSYWIAGPIALFQIGLLGYLTLPPI